MTQNNLGASMYCMPQSTSWAQDQNLSMQIAV